MAMRKVPEVNSSWSDKYIRRYNNVNINVAVNSDAGLFTPLVPNTDNKGLVEISTSVRSLAEKAKANKLTSNELQVCRQITNPFLFFFFSFDDSYSFVPLDWNFYYF